MTWLNITGQAMREAQAATSNALSVPANATRSKKDPNDAYWPERAMVIKAACTHVTAGTVVGEGTDNQRVVAEPYTKLEVRWRITEHGGSGENRLREFTDFWNFYWDAFQSGDKNAKGYFNTARNIGRITMLLRNAGIPADLPDNGYSPMTLDRCFPPDGLSTPLLNSEHDVEIRQRPDAYRGGDLTPTVNKVTPSGSGLISAPMPGVVSL